MHRSASVDADANAYDVAIAGGGPAGAAAAIVLARHGCRVLLADAGGSHGASHDRHQVGRYKVGEGLPPSARSLLRDLGALERVLADGHRASHGTLAFWGSDTPHANDFLFQLHGHGLQLDRGRFDASLIDLAREAGAQVRTGAKLVLDRTGDDRDQHHRLYLQAGRPNNVPVTCRWLIDATGRPATFARQLGARRMEYDRLLAFHMCLHSDTDSDQDGRTLVEAVENGWWYSVLLPSRGRLVAFLGDADLVDRRVLLTREGLWHALLAAPRLAAHCAEHGYAAASDPRGADASSTHLDHASGHDGRGPSWLAIGDAALAFDPLSSKGISNALYTGLRGAQVIIACEHGDQDAAAQYAAHALDIHRHYREQSALFYRMETRWPDTPFWRRRHTPAEYPQTRSG